MWYNFPLLAWSRQPYGSASLNKAGHVLSVCPRTDSTGHQHMATDTQLPTGSFILVLLLPPCSFPMTDMILVFSAPPPPFLFLSLWPSWCSLYLGRNMSCSFSVKQLFPLPLLANTSFSWAVQGWSHCKPCLHTLSSFIVISWIMTIWIPFPFP